MELERKKKPVKEIKKGRDSLEGEKLGIEKSAMGHSFEHTSGVRDQNQKEARGGGKNRDKESVGLGGKCFWEVLPLWA